MANSLFNDFPTVRRAPKILADFQELWKQSENPALTESLKDMLDTFLISKTILKN